MAFLFFALVFVIALGYCIGEEMSIDVEWYGKNRDWGKDWYGNEIKK